MLKEHPGLEYLRPLEDTEERARYPSEKEKASVTKTWGSWTSFPRAAKSTKSFTGFVFPLQMVLCTCFLPIGRGPWLTVLQVLHIKVLSSCTRFHLRPCILKRGDWIGETVGDKQYKRRSRSA